MATVQILKRKLQVIHSTAKITKAMKNASTVKYSKLSNLYSAYSEYADSCLALFESHRDDFSSLFASVNKAAPECIILMTSNKGMCGAFNTELLSFYESYLKRNDKEPLVLICGKQAKDYFINKNLSFSKSYIFDEIPSYENARELLNNVISLINSGKISGVKIIYPSYKNMMVQKPVCSDLFSFEVKESENKDTCLFVPDKETVIKNTYEKILISIIYKKILETALGAQAATLTTMRSAYDTACEYSAQLETEINRKRQSQVTADVIEISAEFSAESEE